MTTPREYVLSRLADLGALAEAAAAYTPPWNVEHREHSDSGPWIYDHDGDLVGDVAKKVADFIAALHPAAVLALVEFLAVEVERHGRKPAPWGRWFPCSLCWDRPLPGTYHEDPTCPFTAALAAALGYEGEGGEGVPFNVAGFVPLNAVDPARPPSAEAAEPHAEGEPRKPQCGKFAGYYKGFPCGCALAPGHDGPHATHPPYEHVPVSAPAQGVGE